VAYQSPYISGEVAKPAIIRTPAACGASAMAAARGCSCREPGLRYHRAKGDEGKDVGLHQSSPTTLSLFPKATFNRLWNAPGPRFLIKCLPAKPGSRPSRF
jgi:hypothetical protein